MGLEEGDHSHLQGEERLQAGSLLGEVVGERDGCLVVSTSCKTPGSCQS